MRRLAAAVLIAALAAPSHGQTSGKTLGDAIGEWEGRGDGCRGIYSFALRQGRITFSYQPEVMSAGPVLASGIDPARPLAAGIRHDEGSGFPASQRWYRVQLTQAGQLILEESGKAPCVLTRYVRRPRS